MTKYHIISRIRNQNHIKKLPNVSSEILEKQPFSRDRGILLPAATGSKTWQWRTEKRQKYAYNYFFLLAVLLAVKQLRKKQLPAGKHQTALKKCQNHAKKPSTIPSEILEKHHFSRDSIAWRCSRSRTKLPSNLNLEDAASNEQIRAGRATQGAPRTSRRLREGPPTGKTKTPESMNRRTWPVGGGPNRVPRQRVIVVVVVAVALALAVAAIK